MNKSGILVSGLHAVDNPSPGLALALGLKAANERVIGACYEPTDTGAYAQDVFDRVYRLPRLENDPEAFLLRLDQIAKECGADVFLPSLDPEVAFLAERPDWQAQSPLAVLLPTTESSRKSRKWVIGDIARTAGFRVPKTIVVSDLDGAIDAAKAIGFPVVLKGAHYEAYILDYQDEIPACYRALVKRWGLPVMVQAQVSGSELVAACICDKPGRLVRWLAMRKYGMNEQGTTWSGVTFFNEGFRHACQRLLEQLQWLGPCEVEVKFDERSEMYTLIEVNTRLPSWIGIGGAVGANLAHDLVRIIRGEAIGPDPGFETGVLMVRQHRDLVVPLSRFIDLSMGRLVYE